MAEQLWTDERITQETQGAMMFSREIARRLMRQVRDDLQAALDAANQRITEQEQEIWKISIHAADQMQRIVELEAQAAWEPLPDGDYTFGLPDSDYVQMIRLRRNGEDFTEWCENPSTGSTSDVDGISLYWSGFRLFRRKEAGE